jgi:glycosyltransferase involved in cell wall biosynthesis
LSDSGGISEYAVQGENALIVPVGDVPKTVEAIEKLLDDPPLRESLIAAGLKTVSGLSDYAAADALVEYLVQVTR